MDRLHSRSALDHKRKLTATKGDIFSALKSGHDVSLKPLTGWPERNFVHVHIHMPT